MPLRGRPSWIISTLSALLLLPHSAQPLPHPDAAPLRPKGVVRVPTPPRALIRALRLEARALRVPRGAIEAGLVAAAAQLPPQARPSAAPGSWARAIAQLAGGGPAHAAVAHALVTDVFERLHLPLPPHSLDYLLAAAAQTRFPVDYPGAIAAPSPNYWRGRRPNGKSVTIRYVVIHDTEGSCASALNWLTLPQSFGSAHFLVCRDGRIYQLVHVADAAWHAGNAYINYSSIGIEHEGFAGSPFSDAQYRATSDILRWLNTHLKLHLQWTRNTVFGHENVPNGSHVDPGTGWNWPHFMALLTGTKPVPGDNARLAAVSVPRAYFRTCPSISCTLLGTANWGEQFYVIARRNGWVNVYFAGTATWVNASDVDKGRGTIVRIASAKATLVRDAPSASGSIIGWLAIGQAYYSNYLDTNLDRHGWWLLEVAHRYGFVCACGANPQHLPPADVLK